MKKRSRALTLIEVILAMWILFIAICFIFEVLRTSYTYITKLKIMGRLQTLSTSKLESFVSCNTYSPDPKDLWITFADDPKYVYYIHAETLSLNTLFPSYTATKVILEAKGPVDNPAIPQYHMSLTTVLLDHDPSQPVTATEDDSWGAGLSTEVRRR